jgi:ATP-dependent DNA ligase
MRIDNFKYFYPERPRLLHIEQPLFEELSRDGNWVAEPKYNGSRLQLHFVNGAWQFWNRHEQPMVYTPNRDVLDALAGLNLKGYWLFDGELRHNKTKGVRHQIVLYDVFIQEGKLLLGKSFADRRGLLETLLHYRGDYHVLGLAPQYEENFRQVFELLTQDEEIEGLVLKNLQGQLQLGRSRAVQSRWMLKVRQPSNRYQF